MDYFYIYFFSFVYCCNLYTESSRRDVSPLRYLFNKQWNDVIQQQYLTNAPRKHNS